MMKNTELQYVDQTFGDKSVPEIMDQSSTIDKTVTPIPTEQVIKMKKTIAFREVGLSAYSSTTQGHSQKIIDLSNTQINNTQLNQSHLSNNKFGIKQKSVSVYKTHSISTNNQTHVNFFKMNTSAFGRVFMYDYLKILIDLYKKIRKTHIFSYNDIPELEMKERISYEYDKFSLIYYKNLEKKMHQNKPFTENDMLFVLLRTHLAHFIQMGFILVFFFTCKIGSSLCIRELLNAISDGAETKTIYMWATLICFSLLLISMLDQHYVRVLVIQYQSLRILLMKHIHTKVSSLSAFTISQNNIGQLMNLVSNDLKILETKTGEILKLPLLPLPTIAAAIISYYRFGIYSLVGLSFLIACVPIQTLLGKMSKKYFSKKAQMSDKRMQITNEVLESIRLIKLYSWEEAFMKMLNIIRSQDLRYLLGTKIIQTIESSISLTSGIFSCFLMFLLVLKYEDPITLTIANMFSTLDIFVFLRQEVISQSGIGITGLFEIKVIMKRIVDILSIESKEMLCINKNDASRSQINDSVFCPIGEIRLVNFSAFWKYNSPVLINLSANILPGELVTIMGPVSSGKSSFLSCFLKEIPYYTGEINFKGRISYVEQEPYIFNMSFRDNILFGQGYDHDLYSRVIEVCNLNRDIEMFGGDDSFEIGEKGNNLSGGQRARLALARALYSQADIYLLDDPLSALDYNVSKEIFYNAIQVFLKGKTVLLTTHSLDTIQQSDKVIALDGGYIVEQGDPKKLYCFLEELQSSPNKSPAKSPDKSLLNSQNTTDQIKDDLGVLDLIKQRSKRKTKQLIKLRKDDSIQSLKSKKQLCSYNHLNLKALELEKPQMTTLKSIRQTEDDSDNQKVSFSTYKKYFSFCSYKCLYPVCLVLFMSNEVSYILFTKTMGKFGGDNIDDYNENITWLGIYTLAYFLIMFLKKFLLNYLLNNNNYQLHSFMIKSILRSKIAYFDKTPIGSIINRFSSDLSNLDIDLSKSLCDSLEVICNTATLITTIVLLNPYFIIITFASGIFLSLFFSLSKNVLIATKQFDLNLKSSVFSFFNTSISGILPIKLFNQTNQFRLQFNKILDNSLRTAYTYWFTNRGFGMYIIFIAQISSIIGIYMAIAINNNSSNLGQTITFFISLGYKLQSGLRQLIQLDVVMSSAQRAINLTQLDQEPPLRTKYDQIFRQKRSSKRLSRLFGDQFNYPIKGKIEFKNVYMSYSEDKKTVLNGISFIIEPGQKVAFVGRTGAGKSSILQALFRLFDIHKWQTLSTQVNIGQTQKIVTFQNILETEANQLPIESNQLPFQAKKNEIKEEYLETLEQQNVEGAIKIDNHNIEDIGIKTLRDGFTIIPQIPFIFTGTIKMNIDPFGLYTDEQIWEIIKDLRLEEKIKEFPKGLNTEISNSSETFSAGQKQLLCLGRAILKRSKILILDEVTSNCDAYTEDLILDLINKKFVGSTIIAIAHRLATIANYDRIFVLDKGKVAEQGTSEELLMIQDGIFATMVNSSGLKTSQLIRKVQRNRLMHLNYLEVPSPNVISHDQSELKSN